MSRLLARAARAASAGPGWLLLLGAVLCGYAALVLVRLAQAPVIQVATLYPAGIYLVGCLLTALILRFARPGADAVAAAAALFLAGIGVLAQFRMARFVETDLSWTPWIALPLGLILMLLTLLALGGGRLSRLEAAGGVFALAALGLLGFIAVAGQRFRGALFLPGHINPAELVKVFLPLYAATHLARHREEWARGPFGLPLPSPAAVLPFGLVWGGAMALLVWQRDFGMIVLLNLAFLGMLTRATGRPAYVGWGLVVAAAAAAALLHTGFHGGARIAVWRDPYADETGQGWQILQGLTALYTGGLWGVGFGAGAPHQVPIASSDFIYAVIGEELGLAGCVVLVAAYVLLFHRGLAAAGGGNEFVRTLVTGLVLLLAFQTLWNIAGVTKAVPLTGVPLPFISQGGSSLVTSFAMLGLILAASDSGGGGAAGGADAAKKRKKPKKG